MAVEVHAWWSSSSKSDVLTMADSEAPMPPVFKHSSTDNGVPGLLDALADELSSMLKGFRLIRSLTCVHDSRQHDVKRPSICLRVRFRTDNACAATGRGGWLQSAHPRASCLGWGTTCVVCSANGT